MTQPVPEQEPVVAVIHTPQPTRPQNDPALVPQPSNPDVRFTAEDIETARKQEKDKVYSQIESLRQSVAVFEQERNERLEAQKQAQTEAEEQARLQREAEESLADRMARSQADFEAQLREEREQREALVATLQKEREWNALQAYRSQAVAAAQDQILPELLDYVVGNTPEEIDASIAGLAQRSASILDNTSQALQQQRQAAPGPRVTAPPVGPLENQTATQTLTAADIANMSMSDYAGIRNQLGVTGSGSSHGLFDR